MSLVEGDKAGLGVGRLYSEVPCLEREGTGLGALYSKV